MKSNKTLDSITKRIAVLAGKEWEANKKELMCTKKAYIDGRIDTIAYYLSNYIK
jgi:hypothetical protein